LEGSSRKYLTFIEKWIWILALCDQRDGVRVTHLNRVIGDRPPRINESLEQLISRQLLERLITDGDTFYRTTERGRQLAVSTLLNLRELLGKVKKPRPFPTDLAFWLRQHMIESASANLKPLVVFPTGGVF
jgi:hypothetical protein